MKTNTTLINDVLAISIRKICNLYKIKFNQNTIKDIFQNEKLIRSINESIQKNNIFRTRKFDSILEFYVFRNLLYFLIREIKPDIVIETGVLHGLTSTWILQALEDNKKGKLISIDLPMREWEKYMGSRPIGPGSEVEEDELGDQDSGWIVPNYLRDRWELVLGPSEVELVKICNQLDKVDLFVHDSDHSYKNMKFECDFILEKYPEAKIVIDDFYHNNYTFELLSSNQYEGIFMDDLDHEGNVFPSTALLKKK